MVIVIFVDALIIVAVRVARMMNEWLRLYFPLIFMNYVVCVMMVHHQVAALIMEVVVIVVYGLVLAVRYKMLFSFLVFAKEMRVNEGIMDGRNFNSIIVIHLMTTHHFGMQRLLWHLLHKLLNSVIMVDGVACIVIGLHLDNKVALLSVDVGRVENARI